MDTAPLLPRRLLEQGLIIETRRGCHGITQFSSDVARAGSGVAMGRE